MCAHSWEMPLTRFERYALVSRPSLAVRPQSTIQPPNTEKYSYIAGPVYMLCNGFVKLSLLAFYLHLSPQRWFRVAVWTSITLVAVYTTVITFLMFFVCNPPRKAYDFKVQGGSCFEAAILYMATAVSNIVTDTILFVLPIPMVYQLHMPKVQKLGAIIVFGIGSM